MKLVKSTRDYDEHLENLLTIQEMKSKGLNDREVCKVLHIGASTLQEYKKTLIELDVNSLSPEGIVTKKSELDDQIQVVISKLHDIAEQVDTTYKVKHKEILDTLLDAEIDLNTKISLKRSLRYPVEDIIQVQKTLLEAILVRSRIWGVEKDSDGAQINQHKKVIFNFSDTKKVEVDKSRLNNVADTILEKIHNGMQLSEEGTEQ
jgi:hypothetical protein